MKFTSTQLTNLILAGLATMAFALPKVPSDGVRPVGVSPVEVSIENGTITAPVQKDQDSGTPLPPAVIARRDAGEAADIAEAVAEVIKDIIDVFNSLEDGVKQDNLNRGQFTQNMVSQLATAQPSWNYVICHTAHVANWDGVKGTDWYHEHQEFDIQIGGTIGYEIYGAASGEFTRQGDGGFLNWAWEGVTTTNDQNGAHLIFAKH